MISLKAALDIGEYIVMLYKGKVQLAGTADDFNKTGDAMVEYETFGGQMEQRPHGVSKYRASG